MIQGGCLCGAVRYEAAGQPYNITHCHCTDCRRSSGAAFVTPLTFLSAPDADEVDVTVCSFDHPEIVSPADHTWVDDRLPWIRLGDELPAYGQSRPNHAA